MNSEKAHFVVPVTTGLIATAMNMVMFVPLARALEHSELLLR